MKSIMEVLIQVVLSSGGVISLKDFEEVEMPKLLTEKEATLMQNPNTPKEKREKIIARAEARRAFEVKYLNGEKITIIVTPSFSDNNEFELWYLLPEIRENNGTKFCLLN